MWGVATLFVLAVGAADLHLSGPSSAFPAPRSGCIAFLVVGTPASGGGSAPGCPPGFWRAVSQCLPPGAAITSMRDVVYFEGHRAGGTLLVLGIYDIGAIGAIAV